MRIGRRLAFVAVAIWAALAAASASAQPLAGTWTVTSIGGDPVIEPAPTLTIEGTTASGSTSCNRYFGDVTIDGNALTFGVLAVTKMLCLAEPVMAQEQAYLAALEQVKGFSAAGDELALLDAAGVPIVTLTSAEFVPMPPPGPGAEITILIPGAASVAKETVAYRCGTRDVEVDFINAGATSLAVLRFADELVVAANVIAASGARYAGGRYILWTHGDDVDLYDLMTAGGEDRPVECIAAP